MHFNVVVLGTWDKDWAMALHSSSLMLFVVVGRGLLAHRLLSKSRWSSVSHNVERIRR